MALQIPDAPNVESTQPVLRQASSINPQFEQPNFKVDVSEPVRALKDVGNAYAGFVEQQTEMYMGAACNEFNNYLIKRENYYKENYKGLQANDLYARLEKDAKAYIADITGEPKDDGKVRIANPELQRRFVQWADNQMPAYHSRMNAYTASELEQANKLILKNGIENTNAFVMGISNKLTAGAELKVAKEEYMRAARLSAPGMPEDYQMAEAARLMDESVYAMMKAQAETNILDALDYYNSVPEIQNALSAKSKAALQAAMQKEFKDQAASRSADLAASGAPVIEKNGYLDTNVMREVFPRATKLELERLQFEVMNKAEEINAAANEAKNSVREKEYSRVQNYIANVDYTNANDVAEIATQIAVFDKRLADDFTASAQQELADLDTIRKYNDLRLEAGSIEDAYEAWEGNTIDAMKNSSDRETARAGFLMYRKYYKDAKAEYKATHSFMERNVDHEWNEEERFIEKKIAEYESKRKEEFIAGYFSGQANSDEMLELSNKVQQIKQRNSEWINSPVYQKAFAEATEGTYHGEYRAELEGMPIALRKNIAAVIEYNQRYNEVLAANPHLESDVNNHIEKANKKSTVYKAMLKQEVVKDMDAYKNRLGAYPARGSIEYNKIINEAVHNAESPEKARITKYLSDQAIQDLQSMGIDPYLHPEKAYDKLDDLDRLPLKVQVLKEVESGSDAEDVIDALIDSTSGIKRDTIKFYKESMIKTLEETGNIDYWILFIDGLTKQ